MRVSLFILLITAFVACREPAKEHHDGSGLSTDITPEDIHTHIRFLSSDNLRGRKTGSAGEAIAARYIADHFKNFGLQPMGDDSTYYQQFTVDGSPIHHPHQTDSAASSNKKRITRNVIGKVEGSEQPDTYILIGAHYDHLGVGQAGSSLDKHKQPKIHNGADDNASGTSGVLELAQYFSNHRTQKSLLFVTFSGEEMGLLGSLHFVNDPVVPLDEIQTMINLDMIGRLRNSKLIIFGTGTSNDWPSLIKKANIDSLQIKMVPDGTGASDHTSFYDKKIPVLHYFTNSHTDYHHPSDDPEFINFEGEARVLEHLKRLITAIDTLAADQLIYHKAPITQHDTLLDGP